MKNKKERIIDIAIKIDGKYVVTESNYEDFVRKIKEAKENNKDCICLEIPNLDKLYFIKIGDAEEMAKNAKKVYQSINLNDSISEILIKSLKDYLTDLTFVYKTANKGKLVGRDEELQKIWNCLNSKRKNNVILIGEDGVGKTSILSEITMQIVSKRCPEEFKNCFVFRFEINKFLKIRSRKTKKIITRMIYFLLLLNKNSILIIDDLMSINYDIYSIILFDNVIANSNIRVIAEINTNDYKDYYEGEKITRDFYEIFIKEPTIPELYEMIPKKIRKLEKKYLINISNELTKFAIDTSYYLSNSNSANPESTLDTIEYAMSKASMDGKNEVDKQSILSYYNIDFKLANSLKPSDKKIIAYHEAGHYLVRKKSERLKKIENAFVSILPIGDALGLNAEYFKIGESSTECRDYYIDNIASCLGGRVAEEIYTKCYSSGASSDLSMATSLAEQIVLSFGLSKNSSKNRSYMHSNYLETFLLTEELRNEINKEINEIIDEAYKRAKKIILENRDLLEKIVDKLLEDGILTGRELDKICKENS